VNEILGEMFQKKYKIFLLKTENISSELKNGKMLGLF
jgi:hypothetical protein